MKPTIGHGKSKHTAGAIPKTHDLLPLGEAFELEKWVDQQLDKLVVRFADYTTHSALMADIASRR